MDKNKILKQYITEIYSHMDDIREHYPKAMAPEIIQMEKGYRLCATKSVEWIEMILNVLDMQNVEGYTSTPQQPIARLVDVNTEKTNSMALPTPFKKKKFLQVASEASKDLAGDVFRAAQWDLPKREEKK